MLRDIDSQFSKNRDNQWPFIDYKFKNVGTEVAIVNRVRLEVVHSRPHLEPNLYFQLLPVEGHNLLLRVVNLGWGPAIDAQMEFLVGRVRRYLSLSDEQYLWQGTIKDQASITIYSENVNVADKVVIDPDDLDGRIIYIEMCMAVTMRKKYSMTPYHDIRHQDGS